MFCQNCGKELQNGIKFCPNCGKELDSVKKNKKGLVNLIISIIALFFLCLSFYYLKNIINPTNFSNKEMVLGLLGHDATSSLKARNTGKFIFVVLLTILFSLIEIVMFISEKNKKNKKIVISFIISIITFFLSAVPPVIVFSVAHKASKIKQISVDSYNMKTDNNNESYKWYTTLGLIQATTDGVEPKAVRLEISIKCKDDKSIVSRTVEIKSFIRKFINSKNSDEFITENAFNLKEELKKGLNEKVFNQEIVSDIVFQQFEIIDIK